MAAFHPITEARAPSRCWTAHSPLAVNVVEWGPADGRPLFLVHGGGDFARSFDRFAPRLADAGWRVIAWDQRGHGDSERADLYAWQAELRDAVGLLRSVPGGPHPLVGHSKGGVLAIEVAVARPELVASVVAIDGFVRRLFPARPPAETLARWLDHQRRPRPARALPPDELAEARQAVNPRVDRSWLRYLVDVGARPVDPGPSLDRTSNPDPTPNPDPDRGAPTLAGLDRRTWKIDTAAFPVPPHSLDVAASLARLAAVRVPLLALKAGVEEPIAGQPTIEELRRRLPPQARFELLDGLGHFAHVEDPERVARLCVSFLAEGRPAG